MLDSTLSMRSLWQRIFAAATLLLVLTAPAFAQEGESESQDSAAEEKVRAKEEIVVEDSLPFMPRSNTIATKLPVDLAWTPANVGLVGADRIEERNAEVLGRALHNVSGINTQPFSGIFDLLVIRGFDSISSGLVLIDGAPEPEAAYYQMYNTERVEVFKGPAGFLYGSNPLAGVVNIARKQPIPSRFTTVGFRGGSFNTYEGTLDFNAATADGDASFRLNGMWRDSDGYRDGTESTVAAINPAATWRLSDRSSLYFNFEYVDSDYTPDAGLPLVNGRLADVPRERSYSSPLDFSNQEIYRFQVDYETQVSDRLTVRNKLYQRTLDWKTDGTLLLGAFPLPPFGDLGVIRTLTLLEDDQKFLGNQLEAVFSGQTGGIEHHLLMGLELARNTDRYSLDIGLLPPIGLFNPVETTTEPFILPGQSAAGDSKTTIVAPYLVDQMVLSERVQVMAGLRFDVIDFDDEVTTTSRSDEELSPMLGIVVAPTDGLWLYANAGQSFAPPSPRVVGERKPEESQQLELGLRKSFHGGRVHSTLAAYQIERDNIAIPDDNGFTQQIGDQRARGIELEISARLGNGVDGSLGYAYNDSELTNFAESIFFDFPPFQMTFDRSGNKAAFSPEHLFDVWLNKRFDNGLLLSGGVRYVDEQFIAEDNVVALDSFTLLDLAASYGVGAWRVTLHLENVTDEEYENRGFGSSAVIPGDPFSATLGFQYRR